MKLSSDFLQSSNIYKLWENYTQKLFYPYPIQTGYHLACRKGKKSHKTNNFRIKLEMCKRSMSNIKIMQYEMVVLIVLVVVFTLYTYIGTLNPLPQIPYNVCYIFSPLTFSNLYLVSCICYLLIIGKIYIDVHTASSSSCHQLSNFKIIIGLI